MDGGFFLPKILNKTTEKVTLVPVLITEVITDAARTDMSMSASSSTFVRTIVLNKSLLLASIPILARASIHERSSAPMVLPGETTRPNNK